MHQVERVVDLLERHHMGDKVVDGDLPLHVPIDDLRHVGASPGAAESRSFPDAAGDELERPRRDFLTGARDADDDAYPPALVAAFERLTHRLHVADALETVIRASTRELDEMGDKIALYL